MSARAGGSASSNGKAPVRASREAASVPGPDALALNLIREGIETIDAQLVTLLGERLRLARAAGAAKRAAGLPTLDPAREAAVVRRAAAAARKAGLPVEQVRDVFWHIVGLCRGAQTEQR